MTGVPDGPRMLTAWGGDIPATPSMCGGGSDVGEGIARKTSWTIIHTNFANPLARHTEWG